MPLMVPTSQQVEQTPLSLPGAAPLGDNGLGAIAAGANQASDQMRALEIEQQKKRDTTRVFEAEQELSKAEMAMRDQNMGRVGSNAYGVRHDVENWWETEAPKIASTLENETQRTLFSEAAARRREVSVNAFQAHEFRESNRAVNDAMDARDVNSINDGAAGYNNPEAIAKARQDIIETNSARARFNGMPAEAAQAARLDALTKLHSNVIENLAEDSPARAEAYLNKYVEANEIAGSVQDALRNKIKGAKDIVAAQRTADAAWALGKPETEALDWVRKNSEGQEREHALSLVRQQYADREAAINQQQKDGIEAARARYDAGGYAALKPSDIDLLGRVSPGELAHMRSQTPQDRVVTNWNVYYGLIDQATKDPNGFMTATERGLRQYSGDLNQNEMNKLEAVRKDIANNVPPSLLTISQIVRNAAGADIAKNKDRIGQLEDQVTAAVEDEQKRLNRKLTGDEMRKVAQTYMMNITVPDAGWFWFDKQKHLFELTDQDKVAVAYDAIPSDVRAEAEADLKASGREPSPANVVALYQLFLNQGNK